jgi:predicted flap endonuclease-1-like 5' DNA nuclease
MRKQHGLPWWAWVPFLPVLLALLLIWRLRRNNSQRKAQKAQIQSDSIPLPPDSPYRPEPQDDDLAIIKGIGLKSAAALKSAGVRTFAKLAQTSPERLKEILIAAGLRLPDPATWPAQATEILIN